MTDQQRAIIAAIDVLAALLKGYDLDDSSEVEKRMIKLAKYVCDNVHLSKVISTSDVANAWEFSEIYDEDDVAETWDPEDVYMPEQIRTAYIDLVARGDLEDNTVEYYDHFNHMPKDVIEVMAKAARNDAYYWQRIRAVVGSPIMNEPITQFYKTIKSE